MPTKMEKNLQNCHYGTLCFALMGFLVCGKKIFLPPSNFWISCHDKNRTDCTVSALSYIFFFVFLQPNAQCVRNHLCSQVFTMGCLWGVIIPPDSLHRWWAGGSDSTLRLQPAIAAEKTNENTQTKNFITWCFTACDGIVLFLWFLGSWLSAVVGSLKSWPTLKGRWCWWWWQVVLLEEEDLPAVPFRPERGPGQVVKPPFNVPQLFMCVCGSR